MNDEVEEIILELGLETLDHEGGWFQRTFTGELDANGRPNTTSI